MNPVTASAPCRADLAGGTLDLWPLGLLVDRAVTVNAALEIFTGCSIEPGGESWRFHARDGDERLELDELPARPDRAVPPAFKLAVSVAAWFELPPARIATWSEAARGSGLGGSSALIVALIAAARALRGGDWQAGPQDAVALARDLEARILGLPAGSQDHVAAWHGGLSLIEYGPGGWTRSSPPGFGEASAELGEALVVVDSGVSHHSGMNNWQVYRAFLEGDLTVRTALEEVARASVEMAELLSSGAQGADLLGGVAAALDREWRARRRLSEAVSCPEVDALVAAASEAGGRAKVCGAGGGGCVVACPGAPEDRPGLVDALERAGGRVLPARLASRGVQVDSP
jgi:D-glycero-alpha-D-manno-heptose-7-phosphate kinase